MDKNIEELNTMVNIKWVALQNELITIEKQEAFYHKEYAKYIYYGGRASYANWSLAVTKLIDKPALDKSRE